MLSWSAGLTTLALQTLLTDWTQLDHDAASFAALFGDELMMSGPSAQHLALYIGLWAFAVSNAFFFIPSSPSQQSDGVPKQVPRRRNGMKQHALNAVDYSYIALNSLCMPGLFYHFVCLLRCWGLDLAAPPLFGIYPSSMSQLVTEALPAAAVTTALYFLVYELIYYHWHRAMHQNPTLYTYVHRHHHQQTYPDRPAIDTLNTACLESQVGLYMQLGVMWSLDKLLHIHNLAAGIWFFTIAGWLSVLEHDKLERALPYDLFRADEHHMHHSFVRCNYSPYSTLWDRVFGTHKPFEVSHAESTLETGAATSALSVGDVLSTACTPPSRARRLPAEMCASDLMDEPFNLPEPRVDPLLLQIVLDRASGSAGLSLSSANRVLKVRADSAADIAGCRALDLITEVDGVRCSTSRETLALLLPDVSQASTRRFIRVLRPKDPMMLGRQGVPMPTSEVLDTLVRPSWSEAEAQMAELSNRIWRRVHLKQQPLESGEDWTAADVTNTTECSMDTDTHLNDSLCAVAHSEKEYMAVTRGGAALVLAFLQGLCYILLSVH